MSRCSISVLSLLQRCVAVRQIQTLSCVTPAAGAAAGGFIQQRPWTSLIGSDRGQKLRPVRSTVGSGAFGFCSKAEKTFENQYLPLSDYGLQSEPEKKEVYIVQVKGLAWSCSSQDVLQFFSGCRIRDGLKGIHMHVDRLGRPTGKAFIELEHEEDLNKALDKHMKYLGPRYIEVSEVTKGNAEDVIKNATQHEPITSDIGVVRLRGLPFLCTEAEIARFFGGLDIIKGGITIVTAKSGRTSGVAFVQFSTQQDANAALKRDRNMIGNRYIEVFPSTSKEITRTEAVSPLAKTGLHPQKIGGPIAQSRPKTGYQTIAAPTHYVHVRGLPFQVSAEDIVEFFSPLAVSKILIEYSGNGRMTGEADVQFSCHLDAVAAMSKDKQSMGERYIELFLNSE